MLSAAKASEPRSSSSDDLDYRVNCLADSLQRAAHGVDTAWNLSNAFEMVDNHFRGQNGQISSAQRDELLADIIRASIAVPAHLPKSYSRDQIDAGMQALAGQVMVWAEPPQRTEQRSQHALCDLVAYARMFRNDLHNISLVQEIEQRAWGRRIEQLVTSSGAQKKRSA
jgi:hypothetical protein